MSSARVSNLRQHLDGSTGPLRPVLTSLNGDQSWLLSFPLPSTPGEPAQLGKKYYHIVMDPWLKGTISVLSTWFLGLELLNTAAATDGAGVDDIAREIEDAAANTNAANIPRDTVVVDAIFIHFHYLDHMHQASLVTFDPDIPVLTTPEAAATMRSWDHFKNITTMHDFDPASEQEGWQSLHPGGALPQWLSVFRLKGHAVLNFATGIVWSHDSDDGHRQHELVLNSPHGIRADLPNVRALLGPAEDTSPATKAASPPLRVLAMLAALKDSFTLGMATTLGLDGSLALEDLARPKYWVRSHDMLLKYMGFFMRLTGTHDVARSVDEKGSSSGLKQGESRRPNLVDVANGANFVLT
ncbi:hypothetical protein M406DRAFT_294404 [Cryphonectria parasitica EP155]|uniref:Uncharacterized protein n=1 Tax=Cryphonectria parasitica (strain ATCC 38755 / EP155) TaxID=660469 RepID=A0A9P5CL31_CRYP1|nr:uncharacterized protein M406DRAFT_294404 [Cryphonectria parasitica EP155]KAF3762648.1 hypothetical protein M406DRAFT_294404 [Cryphonectria parasitica EP155]